MLRYSLPVDLDSIGKNQDEYLIDMSDLNFDMDANYQKRAAFVFLRNTGLKANLDFSRCSYEDKEEYLMLFLQCGVEVQSDILASTWMEILSAKDGGDHYLPTILSADEIKRFCEDHREYINELYQFINSLPIHAMMVSGLDKITFNTDEFEKTDYSDISLVNFVKLIDFDSFILLIDNSTPQKMYTKLFVPNEYYINQITNKLPYLSLIRVIYQGEGAQDAAIESIKSLLVPPEPVREEESSLERN